MGKGNSKVTFIFRIRLTNCSGGGRKSGMMRNSIGSSVYLVRFFICLASFSPVSGANDPYHSPSRRESNSQYSTAYPTKTIISRFRPTVYKVARDDASGIVKCFLCRNKIHGVSQRVLRVLGIVPFEARF